MKVCINCLKTKPYSEFYKHPQMADGYLGRCKECQKELSRRRDPIKIKAYEKIRAQNPERKIAQAQCQRNRRAKFPQKERAHYLVSQALKKGHLVKQPCQVCGNVRSEAHHPDYNTPLAVYWLCFTHHRMVDAEKLSLLR